MSFMYVVCSTSCRTLNKNSVMYAVPTDKVCVGSLVTNEHRVELHKHLTIFVHVFAS